MKRIIGLRAASGSDTLDDLLRAWSAANGVQASNPKEKNPLLWLDHILNGVEHANFFENRATEYAKGALTGSWADVWAQAPALQEAGVSA